METAKIDIRKLQLLNDRISSTIEALNQVRLSVHGLTHTNPIQGSMTNLGYGWNPVNTVGSLPTTQLPWNTQPFTLTPPLPTTNLGQPYTITNVMGGLSHSVPEINDPSLLWSRSINDPWLLARISQTFPFLNSPIPGP